MLAGAGIPGCPGGGAVEPLGSVDGTEGCWDPGALSAPEQDLWIPLDSWGSIGGAGRHWDPWVSGSVGLGSTPNFAIHFHLTERWNHPKMGSTPQQGGSSLPAADGSILEQDPGIHPETGGIHSRRMESQLCPEMGFLQQQLASRGRRRRAGRLGAPPPRPRQTPLAFHSLVLMASLASNNSNNNTNNNSV